MKNTDILILGAGIGGFETFRTLEKKLDRKGLDKQITIVDKNNYFTFVPMLHEVATASVQMNHCAVPLRKLTANSRHQYIKTKAKQIYPEEKIVETNEGQISYEYCVAAVGSKINYFGIQGTEEYTYNVRTLSAAMELHNDFLGFLEKNQQEISINIVGGGYTGVEVVGQFDDMTTDLQEFYPNKNFNIRIIQSSETVIPHMKQKVQQRVTQKLRREGVEVITNSRAKEITQDSVILDDNTKISSDFTIWTAGFANLGCDLVGEKYCKEGRINVNNHLHLDEFPSLYAVGDVANISDPETEITYPQLAEAAHHEGMYAAKHIVRCYQSKQTKPFSFNSKGTLLPVGDWWAVAEIGPFTFSGKFAWWLRRTVYVLFMPGILRKLRIVFDWTMYSFGSRDFIHIEQKDN